MNVLRATLVTRKLKHYLPEGRRGVEAMGPAALLKGWTREPGDKDIEEGGGDG